MPRCVRVLRASSSASFVQRTMDVIGAWRSVDGRGMWAPPCGGSSSITRASCAPPETASNTTVNSLAYSDICSRSSTMTSRWLPGLPSVCRSWSRTPWPLILAQDQEDSQEPHEEGADEVSSPAPSPCAVAATIASHHGRMDGSQDPALSTSMVEVIALPSGDTVAAVALKLNQKNAMLWKSSKKYKSPTVSPDALPAIIVITCVKNTPTPLKTCNNP